VRTTLKQIAQATDMSVTTVSLVLNDKPCRISKEKKDLILETANKMQYRPNLVAVSLVKGSTNTIGLIISDIRNNFFSTIAKGVEDECQKNNWNMILCNTNDKHSKDMEYIRMMADKGVNGIIFGMASESTNLMAKECIDLLESEHMPYLLVDRYVDTDTSGIVCVNHKKGGDLATEYLLKSGHRRIACITGPTNLIDSQQRLDGYYGALKRNHISADASLIIEGKYTYESGISAVDALVRNNIKFSAIFAFNDLMAIGAMRALQKYGLKVPEDISIIGYDDIFMCGLLDVPLTTVRQPMIQMGQAAANAIIKNNMKLTAENERMIFEPELVIRKSTKSQRANANE